MSGKQKGKARGRGSNPGIPRKIKPIKWVYKPWLIEAFCHQSQMNKQFRQRRIREVRTEEWAVSLPDDEE